MRTVKDWATAQKIINELLDWKDKLSSKNWDFTGLRITNASPSVDDYDYVVRKELPNIVAPDPGFPPTYTIVFSNSTVSDGDIFPPYVAGRDRDGFPIDAWVSVINGPTTANLAVNFEVGGVVLLSTNLTMLSGASATVHSNAFINPLPKIGFNTKVTCNVVTGGSATLVSVGLVVQKNKK